MDQSESGLNATNVTPLDSAATATPLIDRAWAEWELIQKKIDSVSTFPFTVKAWSVALAGILLGVGKGLEFPRPLLFFTLVVPLIFKSVESKHNAIRDTLSRRAEMLELLISRLMPLKTAGLPENFPREWQHSIGRVPGVALSLIRASSDQRKQVLVWPGPPGSSRWQWGIRNADVLWHKYVARYSDVIFYAAQILLMLVFTLGLTFCAGETRSASISNSPVDDRTAPNAVPITQAGRESLSAPALTDCRSGDDEREYARRHHCRSHRRDRSCDDVLSRQQ